mmetsp:Transcript_54730/g.123203  ORF Transcript_54730/g.123203 Transcript_54730/m.123203 type:complete len:593 (+) Transcript_54730:74-1852(+)
MASQGVATPGQGQETRSTMVVLTQAAFFHKSCLVRSLMLGAALAILMLITWGLNQLEMSPAVERLFAYFPAVLPSVFTLRVMYMRFRCSVNGKQIIITCIETYWWMILLSIVVGPIDTVLDRTLSSVSLVECSVAYPSSFYVAYCLSGSPVQPGTGISYLTSLCENDDYGNHIAKDQAFFQCMAGQAAKAMSAKTNLMVTEVVGFRDSGVFQRDLRNGAFELDATFFRPQILGKPGCYCESGMMWSETNCKGTCISDVWGCPGRGKEEYTCEVGTGPLKVMTEVKEPTVLHAFFRAYFRAAFLEELLKYWAVRRILFSDRTLDSGAILMYGLAAAAGFAIEENIQYCVFSDQAGLYTALMRMVLAVPLHLVTGLMIGTHLGYRKFLGEGNARLDKFAYAMLLPVLTHGTYDFVLMIPPNFPLIPSGNGRLFIAMIIVVLGYLAARFMWLRIDNVCVVHVKELQRAGRVSVPKFCCHEGSIKQWADQDDPLVAQASAMQETRRTSLVRAVSQELLPPQAPTCITRLATCPGCSRSVRPNILFSSDCPFCGYVFPDPQVPGGVPVIATPVVGTAVPATGGGSDVELQAAGGSQA